VDTNVYLIVVSWNLNWHHVSTICLLLPRSGRARRRRSPVSVFGFANGWPLAPVPSSFVDSVDQHVERPVMRHTERVTTVVIPGYSFPVPPRCLARPVSSGKSAITRRRKCWRDK
jgi:hypothetical protein